MTREAQFIDKQQLIEAIKASKVRITAEYCNEFTANGSSYCFSAKREISVIDIDLLLEELK